MGYLLVGRQAQDRFTAIRLQVFFLEMDESDRSRLCCCRLASSFTGIRVGMCRHLSGQVDRGRVNDRPVVWYRTGHIGGTTDISDCGNGLALCQTMRNFHDGTLRIAVDQQIRLGIGQNRTTHLIRPVIIVGDAPQAGFDTADDDRYITEGLAGTLGIDNH